MSRGFGWVQLAALAYLYEHRIAYTHDIARAVFVPGALDPVIRPGEYGEHIEPWRRPAPGEVSASDIRSLRRALRRLRAQGLVASCGKTELMWIMPRGVPARLGWLPRGAGLDMKYGFAPERQRCNQPACICDSKGRIRR